MDTPERNTSESAPTLPHQGPRSTPGRVELDDPDIELDGAERYEPLSTLGVGGMGEVRLLRDRRIGREIAMKVIQRDQLGLEDAGSRFLREARVQGQLEHPAVIPVYDLGTSPEGPYFTMKRIRGLTLEQIVQALRAGDAEAAHTYPLRRLLSAMSTVCLAVAFAHARGVLHRDLKPANVMLGAFGEVHVLDWGLAKLMRDPGSSGVDSQRAPAQRTPSMATLDNVASEPGATAVGEIMGTPGYMAPEQAMGDWERVDGRADVYALGAILFELLTLEPLHEKTTVPDLLSSTLLGADANPSARTPAKGIPPELDAICSTATALDRDDRYASAREMSEAIERFLDGHQDVERRKAMADTHAKTAAVKAALAASGDDAARPDALREAGAALALAPAHREALGTLARVLLTPPTKMPTAAAAEYAERARVVEKSSARGTLVLYSAWLGFVPVVFILGVRSMALLWTGLALITLAIAAAWVAYRNNLGGGARFAVYALGTSYIFITGFALGPLIIVPNLATTNLLAFVLYGEKKYRPAALALALSTMLLPLAGQLAGVLPASYTFDEGAMTVLPQLAWLTKAPTIALLTLANVSLVVGPSLFAAGVRDTVAAAEQRSFLDTWNLRQILPREAQEATNAEKKGE